jgi:hypothetical protein
MTKLRTLVVLTFGLLLMGVEVRADSPASSYKLLKKIPVGGEGGWDYLTIDSAGRRLYIARADRVTVFDLDKGEVAGEVPNTPGIHGVALVPGKNKG